MERGIGEFARKINKFEINSLNKIKKGCARKRILLFSPPLFL